MAFEAFIELQYLTYFLDYQPGGHFFYGAPTFAAWHRLIRVPDLVLVGVGDNSNFLPFKRAIVRADWGIRGNTV